MVKPARNHAHLDEFSALDDRDAEASRTDKGRDDHHGKAHMMHWVTPAIDGRWALGNSIFHSSCMGVAPNDLAGSIRGRREPEEIPRCVRRIGAGSGKDDGGDEPGHDAEPKQPKVGIR